MTARRRKSAFQRAIAAAVRAEGIADLCAECGGLQPGRPDIVQVALDAEPARCPACGLVLGEDGRPVGYRDAEGVVHVTVVELVPAAQGEARAEALVAPESACVVGLSVIPGITDTPARE